MESAIQAKEDLCKSTSQSSTRLFRGFGSFKVEAGNLLSRRNVMDLATVMGMKKSFIKKLKHDDAPGLCLLSKLEKQQKISSTSIDYLLKCLEDRSMNLHGLKKKIRDIFVENGNENLENIENENRKEKELRNVNEGNRKLEENVNLLNTPRHRKPSKRHYDEKGTTKMKRECSDDITSYGKAKKKLRISTKQPHKVSETSTGHGLGIAPNPGPNSAVHQNAIYEVTSMERVLNMTPGIVVPSVKGVLVKIGLQRVSFRTAGTIFRLQNATRNFLTAIVDEEIQSTLCFREGDVIEVNNFITKRSQDGNSNTCFLLSVQGSTIQKVTDEQLLSVACRLPVFECKQIRGICTYLQAKPYEACEKENCREKKLKNTDNDPNKLNCPRCGTEYFRPFQKLGWYIEVDIGDGSKEASEDPHRPIIFKNTVMDIFQKMEVPINPDQNEVQKKFEELFNEKEVRAIVRPGHPRVVIIDLMLVPRSQGII